MEKTETKGYISLEELKEYLETLMPKDKERISPEREIAINMLLDIYNWVKVKIKTNV